MDRLYIDDLLVDVGKDTGITVAFVSNLFRDVSKISGNSTYSIKLPRTAVNMSVFGYADRVDSRSQIPYRKHSARLYRDGVEIFKDAEASLLSASDEGYEVTVIWGCRPKFTDLVNKGLSIRDIQSDGTVTFEENPDIDSTADFMAQGYGYALMYAIYRAGEITEWHGSNEWGEWNGLTPSYLNRIEGSGSMTTGGRAFSSHTYAHPSASVAWILDRIRQDMGVDFQWTGDAKTMIDSLIIPLVTKEANDLTFQGHQMTAAMTALPSHYDGRISLSVNCNDAVFGQKTAAQCNSLTVLTSCDLMVHAQMDIMHEWEDIFEWPVYVGSAGGETMIARKNYYRATEVVIRVEHPQGDPDEYRIGNSQQYYVGDLFDKHMGFCERIRSEGIISVEEDDVVTVIYKTDGNLSFRQMQMSGHMSAIAVDGDEVPYNAEFPIVENLPDIKVIDFVKFLCCITGTFPVQKSDDGVVRFLPYDTLTDNIARASDWSSRLIPKSDRNAPAKISYKMDGWARHNRYKWKKDDKVHGGYDGDLLIDDDTLDEERDVITFPFAASDNLATSRVQIPLYESSTVYDEDEEDYVTEFKYSKCEPRIVRINGQQSQTVFDMNMQDIIASKYGLIQACLDDAKVIEETIDMSGGEVASFDETIPVWLAQYGAYFAVLEIKAGSDGRATVKMVRIKQEYVDAVQPSTDVYHSVTTSLTNVTASVANRVKDGDPLTVQIIPNSNCGTPTVSVTMGGTAIQAYDSATGIVHIGSVTGDVHITASASVVRYNVDWMLQRVSIDAPSTVEKNSSVSWLLTPFEGYTIDHVTVTMGGNDISSAYNASTGRIVIQRVTADVHITATASSMNYAVDVVVDQHITFVGQRSAVDGVEYTAMLKPATGYKIDTVTIEMETGLGGQYQDITLQAWNRNANKVVISSVTGSIIITATSVPI